MTPIRLSLMATLGADTEYDFATLRGILEADDSVISKGISHLERAGYIAVTKGYAGNRPRTWVRSTGRGRKAYAAHLGALRAIMGDAG